MDALRSLPVSDVPQLPPSLVGPRDRTEQTGPTNKRWLGALLVMVVAIWILGGSHPTSATQVGEFDGGRPDGATTCAGTSPDDLDADEFFWAHVEARHGITDC